ncbi:MAG: hypothetical protein COT74_07650 [Bdellovibrionales bacterium CG10_big_fil_rev_8_21_14_0_10_45_34]|nr:MAG: hypothetical protein COT74_07650 [Bdellovibrionales bacterium CG10_big_fil_rev_8_21_14_0_10_45_34]
MGDGGHPITKGRRLNIVALLGCFFTVTISLAEMPNACFEGFTQNLEKFPQYEKGFHSVVGITPHFLSNEPRDLNRGHGAGVMIGRNPNNSSQVIVLTAAHVVKCAHSQSCRHRIEITNPYNGKPHWLFAHNVYWVDPSIDAAIVLVEWRAPFDPVFADIGPNNFQTNKAAAAIGYPSLASRKKWNYNKPQRSDFNKKLLSLGEITLVGFRFNLSRLNSNGFVTGGGQPHILATSADFLTGNSGGAILDAYGRLAGIAIRSCAAWIKNKCQKPEGCSNWGIAVENFRSPLASLGFELKVTPVESLPPLIPGIDQLNETTPNVTLDLLSE